MVLIDREAPLRFLRTGYEPDDWVAVFLKTYRTGETAQRVVSVSEATSAALPELAAAAEREQLERVRERQCRSSGSLSIEGRHLRHPSRLSRGRRGRTRPAGVVDDASGSAAAVIRAALLAWTGSCLLAGARVRHWHRGNDAEALGKRAAQRHGRDIVRADDQAPWFRKLQAVDPFTGHDRIPASECGALEPTTFLGLGRSFQPTTTAPSFKRSHLADRAARAAALSLGCRACGCRAARRPAHLSDLLSRGSRIRSFQIDEAISVLLRVERTVSAAVVRTGVADEGSERQEVRSGASRCARRRNE